MSRRICSEDDAYRARLRVANGDRPFCYLCGKDIPKGGKGSGISKEHVIPTRMKKLLDPTEINALPSWPLILPVHTKCDVEMKQRSEDTIELFHQILTLHPNEWNERQLATYKRMGGNLPIPVGEVGPEFTNGKLIHDAMHTWVRGFHAALYSEPCLETKRVRIYPPVKSSSPELPGTQDEQHAEQKQLTLDMFRMLKDVNREDRWDGIDMFGGRMTFRCFWMPVVKQGEERATCVWGFRLPKVFEMATRTWGTPRPWLGFYGHSHFPGDSTVLTLDELRAFERNRKMALA